ncbi:hypothetical protein T484DRAFT_1859369 [Baffinella frigidus]|nr:hypothetical protein T484DRAFT_1859369 [Cryptophyta sp. CCMP2293]
MITPACGWILVGASAFNWSEGGAGDGNHICQELQRTAQQLCTLFSELRHRAVVQPPGYYVYDAAAAAVAQQQTSTQRALCVHLQSFEVALSAWHRANSGQLQQRTQRVLFNVYDAETVMRKGVQDAVGCCVRKPFLQQQAQCFMHKARALETKFLGVTSMFGGVEMLQKMKTAYNEERRRHGEQAATSTTTSTSTSTTTSTTTSSTATRREETTSTAQMRRILHKQHALDSYSTEGVHHESSLDESFQLKYPNFGRDNKCLRQAMEIIETGRNSNLRLQMCGNDTQNGIPVYRHALVVVMELRTHLQAMGLHTHRELVLDWLHVDRWKTSLDIGDMTWADVVGVLNTVVYAMRYCVGTDVAGTVLYTQRVAKHMAAGRGPQDARGMNVYAATESCTKSERVLVSKPRAYARMLSNGSRKYRAAADTGFLERAVSLGMENVICDQYGESPRFALGYETYIRLRQSVKSVSTAHQPNTTAQLGVIFCDIVQSIMEELQLLDVSLANATIEATRASSMGVLVETERKSVASWFDRGGPGTANTEDWMRCHTDVSIVATVFNGYISLIMDETSSQIEDIDYPELVILDMEYIPHSARRIDKSLRRVAADPVFIDFGRPETCRSSHDAQDSLREVICNALDMVFSLTCEGGEAHHHHHIRDRLLCEVSRETAHTAYPTSGIASSIARKWVAATAKAVPDDDASSGQQQTAGVVSVFASAASTYDAFSSRLMLPMAARFIAHDFHSSTTALVQRVLFNVAVHGDRYRELAHKTTRPS